MNELMNKKENSTMERGKQKWDDDPKLLFLRREMKEMRYMDGPLLTCLQRGW